MGRPKRTDFRHQVVPEAGVEHLAVAAATEKGAGFLHQELAERLAKVPVGCRLKAQIAEHGDVVDDATVHWPESRKLVDLGTVKLEAVEEDGEKEQKQIIFDPVPRVQGIEPSESPLLEVRATVYLISGRERRAAH
jgi:catalase